MLDADQRASRYLVQTGRATLTPAQRRRLRRKQGHQSEQAAAHREGVAIVRRSAAERRKHRSHLPA
jgi:hypothetical protein